ncbi:alpha/beta fold hydrolase [Noviherbaspirillum pedocola]|uniref:Alpha/beta hydrolase n=1 Tax=Noviherbaspirillum pedocola TaxID=2801341 RepID=A0A934W954_9BURK|nr:alpha/beta hydrolase [Noviherbaspirillum pedocola]MBK4737638.1 alpha/beta hydrolase [Noviherbaspirillum pedocola]
MNARVNPSIFVTRELCFATLRSGMSVPYVACGTGEPLLFLHGSLCDYRYWNSQTRDLSQHFLCIAISLSHYWPVDDASIQAEFGWKAHVAEVAEFIAEMDLGPVHLVGHSRGGCVAFHLAREYPHLVKSLTLADPGGPLRIDGVPEAALPPATLALRERAAGLIESGAVEVGLELFVDSVSMPGIWKRSTSAFRAMAIANAATLPKQFRDPLPPYTRDAAAQIKCRTLLIEGERSPRMYRDNVAKLVEWIEHAEKRTVTGASHGMNVASPLAFNSLVHSFAHG